MELSRRSPVDGPNPVHETSQASLKSSSSRHCHEQRDSRDVRHRGVRQVESPFQGPQLAAQEGEHCAGASHEDHRRTLHGDTKSQSGLMADKGIQRLLGRLLQENSTLRKDD